MTDGGTGAKEADSGERPTLPHPRDLLAALALLTALPLRRPDPQSEACARASLFFPVAGLLIGALLVAVDWRLDSRLPRWAASLVLVVIWEALSGAVRLRGSGTAGRAALLMVLLTKIAAVAAVTNGRPAALLFAPMLARWSMVVLAVGARDAQAPGRKFNPAISFREFSLTSVYTCAVVFTVAEALGILIVVCVAAVSLAARLLTHRWTDGISWRLLLASAEGFETLVLVLFALG